MTKERHVNLSNTINPWQLQGDDGVVFMHESGQEIGLQLWLPEMSSATADDIESLRAAYGSMLEGCGIEKGRIRFMVFHRPATEDEIMEMRFPVTNDPMQQQLIAEERRASLQRVTAGQYKIHDVYVFIHAREQRAGVTRSDVRAYSAAEIDEILLMMTEERDRIISALNSVGIPATPVVQEGPYEIMRRYYNLGEIGDAIPPYNWNAVQPDVTRQELLRDPTIRPVTLRSQVINSDVISESNSHLLNGNARIVVCDMKDYGEFGHPGMADNVLKKLQEYTYIYVVDVFFANEAAIKNRLMRGLSSAQNDAGNSNKLEDVARANKREAEAEAAFTNSSRFLQFAVSVIVAVDSDQAVKEVRSKIKNEFYNAGQHDFTFGKLSNWEQYVYRLAPYSGKTSDILIEQQVNAVPWFLPYYGPWFNRGGVTLGIFENIYGGQQRITLPKPSEMASHMAVFGTTSSGKSFTIQKLLMNLYMLGSHLRIMDIKNDYQPLVSWLGGQFISCYAGATFNTETVGPNGEIQPAGTPVRYNAFEGRQDAPMEPDDINTILAAVMAMIDKDLSFEESGLLTVAVHGFILSRSTKTIIDGKELMIYRGGILQEFVQYLFTMTRMGEMNFDKTPKLKEIAASLAIVLQVFTTGNYGLLFNGRSTINIKNRVVLFDLSQLGEDKKLTGAITVLINQVVNDSAKKRTDFTDRIVLLSEETGVTGKIPAVKEMLNNVIMAGRAYNLMAILVGQNSAHIKALGGVLNNVTRIIMGRVTDEEAGLLGDILKLNSEQIKTLASLKRRDGQYNELMVREVKSEGIEVGVIRYRPTSLELALFSSDPDAKTLRANTMRESGGDMKRAVIELKQAFENRR